MKRFSLLSWLVLSCLVLLPATVRAQNKGELTLTREGEKVLLTWKLAAPTTYLEVIRNDKESPAGRTRVKVLKPDTVEYTDTVPNAGADYFYWIKFKTPEGKLDNLGPVKAPAKAEKAGNGPSAPRGKK